MLPRSIRKFVKQRLSRHCSQQVEINNETLLIRDGEYCGHRYEAEQGSAVWFCEEDEIKIYDVEGAVIESVPASEVAPPEMPSAVSTAVDDSDRTGASKAA